ncbi:glycosyltransferase family 32 protein [Parapedobacter sp. 10938]|uniref:glycosyltransferase family 32 protein n=1 Tax=Parapedobacter flavus TaxID=3110225 RepID=UPI002DC0122C|nr:glycosyltransferase [Parapedobacter sp. 10938]MEC3879547.1 glycosyltransferase [Parapedobacter sp. 10938]
MIPKIIHYCWLSDDPYPELIEQCFTSWKQNLVGYELHRWDIGRAPKVPWVLEAFEDRKYAFAADYIRFYALYQMGGIYLDADVEVFQSFDAMLANRSFIGYDTMGDIEAAVIGAEKGCGWVKACLDAYEGKHFKREDGSLDMETVPFLIHRILRQRYKLQPDASDMVQHYEDLSIFPAVYFSPKNLFTKNIEVGVETVCVHHFEGQWVKHTPLFAMKHMMHRLVLFLLGRRAHRRVAHAFRKLLGIGQ